MAHSDGDAVLQKAVFRGVRNEKLRAHSCIRARRHVTN